jgi:tetratricopeptide (TPR) repeat protein
MGLSVLKYRPKSEETLEVVFAGEFFTRTPKAEFNRMLALALYGEGVALGILNRGPQDIYLGISDESLMLLEQMEKDLPRDPDFYLCWAGEDDIGLYETPVFQLVTGTTVDKNGYTCPVIELKSSDRSWEEAARVLKEQLEDLRRKVQHYEIYTADFQSCFFTKPVKNEPTEETQSSLEAIDPKLVPRFISSETIRSVNPNAWLLLVEEGERVHIEDRRMLEEVFFNPWEKLIFLEAIPLDIWGLEYLIVPSLRFLRGRVVQDLTAPVDKMPFICRGRWAPVRIIRPSFLAEKRRQRLLKEGPLEIPAYHYHHLLAVDALAAGKPGEALTAFQAAYREAPEPYRALVLRNLSLVLINHKHYEEALGILQDGQKLYPAYTDLRYLIGLAYWKQQYYDEALEECFQAIEKGEATSWYYSDPGAGSYKPMFLVAEIYREKGNLNGAITAYVGSLTYNSFFLPALQRLAQVSTDRLITNKILGLLFQLLDLRQPEVREVFSRNLEKCSKAYTFNFRGQVYHYFYHYHNVTWDNERAVEIPIIREIVKECRGKRILEVGNVLSHYFPVEHDILDKYEKAAGILNQDVVDFAPVKEYDLIVSISTLEHVGWDEEPQQPEKILRAMEVLKTVLAPGGEMVLTLPVGYNPEMDKMLADGRLSFTECYGLKRVSAANEWVEAPWRKVLGTQYGKPYPGANGLVIGIVRR